MRESESGDSVIIAMRIENIEARIRRPRRDGLATPSRMNEFKFPGFKLVVWCQPQ